MSDIKPVKVRTGTYGIYDHTGAFVGRVCTDTGRAMIGDAFWERVRTCKDVSRAEFFKCSACGHGIEVEYDDSRLYDGGYMADEFSYCPYCGAKVVDE